LFEDGLSRRGFVRISFVCLSIFRADSLRVGPVQHGRGGEAPGREPP
jgi:hypothetical protein